jgi:hypothetical protein
LLGVCCAVNFARSGVRRCPAWPAAHRQCRRVGGADGSVL